MPALVTLRDGLRPGGVQADLVTLAHRAQVRALAAACARCGGRRARVRAVVATVLAVARLQRQKQLTRLHFLADRHRQRADHAVDLGEHLVLHLHRLEHDQRAARADAVLARVRDSDDHTREGCGHSVLCA